MNIPDSLYATLSGALVARATSRGQAVSEWLVREGRLSDADARDIVATLQAANAAHFEVQCAARDGIRAQDWLADRLKATPGLDATAIDAIAGTLGIQPGRPVYAVAAGIAEVALSPTRALGAVVGKVVAPAVGAMGAMGDFAGPWLRAPLGDVMDDELAGLAAAHLLPAARQALGAKVPAGAVAAGLHLGASTVKAGWKVTQGELRPGDAVQWVGDRAVAAAAALVHRAALDHTEQVGAAIGLAIGGYVGMAPLGAMVGAAIGRSVREFVAEGVAAAVETIGRALVPVVKEFVEVGKEVLSFLGLGR
jgi:hypothetical protein